MGESFFQRWSRRKAEQADGDQAGSEREPVGIAPASASVSRDRADGAEQGPLPTLDDVARLTGESDYSLFVSRGIDRDVRRAAMKKLFADPHFNRMDGLDIYISDYTKPSPLTPAMLAALQHTQSMFAAFAQKKDDGAGDPQAGDIPSKPQQEAPETEETDPAIARADGDQDGENDSVPLARAEQAGIVPEGRSADQGERHP